MATGAEKQRIKKLEEVLQQIAGLLSPFSTTAKKPARTAKPAPPEEPVSDTAESHFSQGGIKVQESIAARAMAAESASAPFTIEVRFLGGLTPGQKNAFKSAADRWTKVITGALPSVTVDGEVVQGVLILAQGANIDGPGRILGQAGPSRLRPASAGASAFIPAKGEMMFDSADLKSMEANGTLNDVITHEMGHVLGIGTIWTYKHLLKNPSSANPTFVGKNAMREYGVLRNTQPTSVPVENTGGPGTANSHWRDRVFGNELMTGFINSAGNPVSRMTIASLADLGYGVNMDAADPYAIPTARAIMAMDMEPENQGFILANLPIILPEDSHIPKGSNP